MTERRKQLQSNRMKTVLYRDQKRITKDQQSHSEVDVGSNNL